MNRESENQAIHPVNQTRKLAGIANKTLRWLGLIFIALIVLWFTTFPFRKDFIEAVPGVRLEHARPYMAEKDFAPDSAYALLKGLEGWTRFWEQPWDDQIPMTEFWLSTNETACLVKDFECLQTNIWSDQVFSNLVNIIEKSQDKIKLAHRAIKATNPQVPSPPPDANVLSLTAIPNTGRMLSKLLQVSAIRKASIGDFDGSLEDVKTSLLLLNICTRGGSLLHHMVNNLNIRQCSLTLRRIVLKENVPGSSGRTMIQEISEIDRNMEPIAEALKYELQMHENLIDQIFTTTSISPAKKYILKLKTRSPGYTWITTIRFWGPLTYNSRKALTRNERNIFTYIIRACEKPYSSKGIDYPPAITAPSAFWKVILTRKGYLLASSTMPMFDIFIVKQAAQHAELRASVLILAIRSFQQEHNRLPATLDELVPDYFATIPIDPFDQHPFRYKVNTNGSWIVYSVGANGEDDNGTAFIDKSGNTCSYDRTNAVDFVFSSTEFNGLQDIPQFLGQGLRK